MNNELHYKCENCNEVFIEDIDSNINIFFKTTSAKPIDLYEYRKKVIHICIQNEIKKTVGIAKLIGMTEYKN